MNLNENWRLRVKEKVYKVIARFPKGDERRILSAMEELPRNPFAGDIEKMKGEAHAWRRRVGSYRIFFELLPVEKVVYVFRVKLRTSATY